MTTVATDRRLLDGLARQHRAALGVYLAVSLVVIGAGELAALRFGLPERYGLSPVLLRLGLYIGGSTLLWSVLLGWSRQLAARLLDERRRHYEAILAAFNQALGLKDAYSGGHGRRVARYAVVLAEALERPDEEVETIRQAALLHDIGKLGIPDTILTKPGELEGSEWSAVLRHPDQGADILAASPQLRHLAPIVRAHHERLDGSGYPLGLAGDAIPLPARVIAVADVFDALTSNRAYRMAITPTEAAVVIRAAAGSHYDAEVVAVATRTDILERLTRSLP
jgi:HD-GYP domain-containing protein (c-di-GMP phosphodiesterase class II)